MPQLKTGDVVQLRSGGPVMTVDSEGEDAHLVCQWFEGSDMKEATFPTASLQAPDAAEAGRASPCHLPDPPRLLTVNHPVESMLSATTVRGR